MEDLQLEQTVPPDARPRRGRVDLRITTGRPSASMRIQFTIEPWDSLGPALASVIAGLEEVRATMTHAGQQGE